jgi:hypothetical protein
VMQLMAGDVIRRGANAHDISICYAGSVERFVIETIEQRNRGVSHGRQFFQNVVEAALICAGVRA